MSVRTLASTQQRQTLLALQRTKERMAANQTRISTGNRITRPSDDPTASALILDFGNSIQANEQYLKQADSALSFLKSTEDVVTAAIDQTIRLQELAQRGLSPTSGASGRAAMVAEVDSIRTSLLSLANTQSQGKYMFGGTATLGPQPFSGPAAGPITYNGDDNTISLDVTSTSSVNINIPGQLVFFGSVGGQGSTTDLFQAVTDLRDGLATDNTATIQAAYDHLKLALSNLNQHQADLGGRQAGLLNLKDMVSGFNVTLQDLQNTQQDTDYPQAIADYNTDQIIQQATLSTLARSNQTNLFDYLG
ncbi:MAG TPA: flagellar hook-associated protein FlgL [Geothrix sp.]|nr:flagellar hook-associated protein FlgL [Geothrix sp.]